MKKLFCIIFAVVLLAGSFSGCGKPKIPDIFTADDEIITYTPIDPEKTQIVVSRTGNIAVEHLCGQFEKANPDIQVIYIDITGGSSAYLPLIDWIKFGNAPDVVISGADYFNDELTTEYFENLSANPIIQNYEMEALRRTSTGGEVYWLPGPSNISAMMYNKTLFAQYGWEIPKTFDEFVALCDRITADTNGEVQPWNPNAKYDGELRAAIEAFTYEELFGGVENRKWYNDFVAGNAALTGHMEPYAEVLQTLAQHGLLREEHFKYSATTRGKEFDAGKIAMINVSIYEPNNSDYDFGYMPFPTTEGELGYLCDSYSCFVGMPVKEHTDEQAAAVKRFIDYFSSPEGQQVYIANTLKISNVKNVPLSQSDILAELQDAVNAGHMFAALDFVSSVGMRTNFSLQQWAIDIVSGTKTAAECIADADKAPYLPADASSYTAPKALATVPESMTILETSFYMADMYREATGADIGLITNNDAYRGNMMRTFPGEINEGMVTVFKPRSFANGSKLVKVSMTGQQLLDALNNPVGNDKTADCIYAFSGLRCEVSPAAALGSKYLGVTLADGSALDMTKLYTVGIWEGTVAGEYITSVLETYEGSWESFMIAKLEKDGTVTAADDGRITIVR